MTSRRGEKGRIDDIEALRAIAIVFVMIWHYHRAPGYGAITPPSFSHWFNLGVGVDLFFVISGFVVARSLFASLLGVEGGRNRRRIAYQFWTRRVFRLFPSVWLWLSIILLCASFTIRPDLWQSVETNMWASLSVVLHYANYRFATHFMQDPFGASFPYWSLSLEEQFYLILPIAMLLVIRLRFLALFCAALVAWTFLVNRGILGIVFRWEGLAFGVGLAVFARSTLYQSAVRVARRWQLPACPIIITALAGVAIFASSGFQEFFTISPSRSYNLVALAALIAVFFASMDLDILSRGRRLKATLNWIGARSYALYLCHIPALYASAEIITRMGLDDDLLQPGRHILTVIIAVPLAFFCSHLNFKHIEQPFNVYGRAKAPRWFAVARPKLAAGNPNP